MVEHDNPYETSQAEAMLQLNNSKKSLSEYLKIIKKNAKIYKTIYPTAYNLFTSILIPVENNGIQSALNVPHKV